MSRCTITMMSLTGRETLTQQTIQLLNNRGGARGFDCRLFYFAPDGRHQVLEVPANWTVQREVWSGQLPDFWWLVQTIPTDRDWLFLEDDLHPCTNAVIAMERMEVPEDIGLLSFFDMRNQFDRVGIWRDPVNQYLWGSQAIKIPARVIPILQQYSRDEVTRAKFLGGWDTWIGMAVEHAGYRLGHYAPSLVQHVGMTSLAYASTPHSHRPTTRNYPGEDYDALTPCRDPIMPGPWSGGTWRPEDDGRWCNLHMRIHPGGNKCPRIVRGQPG